jgi:lipopolysaccharide assembly outer membrane protein LptD (OstA)
VEGQPIHFSGDKQLWDRKANKVQLVGHGAVSQAGETLTGDHILLDLNARTLDAKGSCVYSTSDTVIWGDEMHFNLDTRTGTVVRGRISNDRFTLRGDRINKLGPGRFQAHQSIYTTCLDCSASWSFESEDMDMETEGYAYLSNVITRVKDAPTFWLPYLAVPLKTKRQTGFLFPRIGFSAFYGTTLMAPFFWATSRSTDMTISLGEYTNKGHRAEWEGRYVLANGSTGIGKFFFIADSTFNNGTNRWALDLNLGQYLPWDVRAQLRYNEVSDNLYPFHYFADLPYASSEAFLRSSLLLNRTAPFFSTYIELNRYRNLLNTAPGGTAEDQATQVDPRTVQTLPTIGLALNDRYLLGDFLLGGMNIGFTQFTRTAGAFDYDSSQVPFGQAPGPSVQFIPGVDPVRKASRFSFTPSVYTTMRVADVVSVVPSFQLRGYVYNFGGVLSPLARGYGLFQADISTQLQKIYDYPNDPLYPRVKHIIRPLLTYSLIPFKSGTSHPFDQQILNAQDRGIFGYNFDDNDIVPYSYTQNGAQYFVPLGNSLSYGLTSQWIRRKTGVGALPTTYENTVEFTAGQAVNFLELTNPVPDPTGPHVLNRFFSTLTFKFDKFNSTSTYYYNPDFVPSQRTFFSSSLTYIFEKAVHQQIMNFERSVTLMYTFSPLQNTNFLTGGLTFSISDNILPSFSASYDFINMRPVGITSGIQFQSPSRCWKLITGVNYSIGNNSVNFAFDLQLNLTGGGFGGFGELANQVVSVSGT